MNSDKQLQEAEKALVPIFYGIDAAVKQNFKKVLDSFRRHRVGVHHFAGVSGYGHDDLGRETLDQVFADVMGAEAAAVRVQLVSGTHAIACCLFGVLRPGDEMLAVVGAPYDTLEEVIGLRGPKPKALSGSLALVTVSYLSPGGNRRLAQFKSSGER
jgi:cystathionine beta-lyase family protein involved in aluminum resistance